MRDCTSCGGLLLPRVRYAKNSIVTTIFAHKASDGKIHSLTEDTFDPDAPDTPEPAPAMSVSLRATEETPHG